VSANSFDVVVIGAGPVGVSGAMAAAMMGARTALVEREQHVGDAGINTGTIPSKTLRETALALSGLRSRQLYGVDLSLRREATIADFTRHRDNVMRGEQRRVESRLQGFGIERITGTASIRIPCVEAADGTVTAIRGDRVLVATRSSPFHPAEFPFEHLRVHDSNEILEIEALPRVLAVVGAGVIGCEYASTFAALGVEVPLVDGRGALLPFLDGEISHALTAAMLALGVRLHFGERVARCDAGIDDGIDLQLASGASLACDDVLVCAGRTRKRCRSTRHRTGARQPSPPPARPRRSGRPAA